MGTQSTDLNIKGMPAFEAPLKVEKGSLTLPFIILLLCMVPDFSLIAFTKPIVAVILLFYTLSAILAGLGRKIEVVGRNIFLIFLIVTVFNFFNCLAYGAPILRWMRMAFCSYIFVAMFFFIVQRINTSNLRNRLWILLVYFISCASLLDFIALARQGLESGFEHRVAGGHAFTVTAVMLILPIFGATLEKKRILSILFFINLLLLFLSASRGVYLIILAATIYSFMFIQKRFSYRLLFLLSVIILGTVIISTPIYDRMVVRFESIAEGDTSAWARVDEANSVFKIARQSWLTLLFGKGYGIPWKPEYKLSTGRETELPGGYMADAPHNDYAARLLYCGLVGLIVQIILYLVIGFNCIAALRRGKVNDLDAYTKVRLHGALLVLMSMMLAGFAGGVFIFFNNNVYEAIIFGMAMADVTAIYSEKKIAHRRINKV
jgi:O-antigen ligase